MLKKILLVRQAEEERDVISLNLTLSYSTRRKSVVHAGVYFCASESSQMPNVSLSLQSGFGCISGVVNCWKRKHHLRPCDKIVFDCFQRLWALPRLEMNLKRRQIVNIRERNKDSCLLQLKNTVRIMPLDASWSIGHTHIKWGFNQNRLLHHNTGNKLEICHG